MRRLACWCRTLLLFVVIGCGGTVHEGRPDPSGSSTAEVPGPPPWCPAGGRVVLASGALVPTALALDGPAVYWAARGEGEEGVILALDGPGETPRLVAEDRSEPSALCLTSDHAVWLGYSPPRLVRAPLGGGAVEVLTEVEIGPTGTAADPAGVYFGLAGALALWPNDGAGSVSLVPEAYPLAIASDADDVYWVQCTPQALKKLPKTGGAVEVLAEGGCAMSLAHDGDDLYWIDHEHELSDQPTVLKRTPAAGGETTALAQAPLADPNPIVLTVLAVDDTHAYFARRDGLYRLPKAGGAAEHLADGTIVDVAVDAQCITWLDGAEGAVIAMRKDGG